jgi:lysyl-tRNA synthetase class 2
MIFSIDRAILNAYPKTSIGVLVATFDNSQIVPLVKELKQQLATLAVKQGITKDHANIAAWQATYKSFGVNPKEYRSSVEALVRRVLDNKGMWQISPVVDLYNCFSVLSVLPMGGYDYDALKDTDITLRFANSNETFIPLGKTASVTLSEKHAVYAAGNKIISWLWNYKDAAETAITASTTRAVFFLDATQPSTQWSMHDSVAFFAACLNAMGATVHQQSIVDATSPSITITSDAQTQGSSANSSYAELIAQMPKPLPPQVVVSQESPSQEHESRKAKVASMQAEGVSAWPAFRPVSNTAQECITEFAATPNTEKTYVVAGRLMTRRDHGKTFFAHVQDRTGSLQLYIKKDAIGDQAFEHFKKYIDLGDIVWVSGSLFITKMGELTLQVAEVTLLSKCLHPLPEKFHGLTDVEQRYRQRYLDLISNSDTRTKFKKRSSIIAAIRQFLQGHDFLEVETPMLHPIPGGAAARPFVTHHNAYDMDLFLRIAPELYLKRLVVGGFERVFEINRNFRNEGVSTRHNPEFTMLEFYMAHGDVQSGIALTEQLLQNAVEANFNSLVLPFQGKNINFTAPFKQLTVEESLIEIGGLTAAEITPQAINATMQKFEISLHASAGHGAKLFALFEACVEQKIVQPTFIVGYPIEVSPLAKRDPLNPEQAARFELFICGMEFANGFTELNDPFDQADRFKGQATARSHGDDEAHFYDADFIKALEFGLPPTVGVGIGIDRLVMLLTDTATIKDVILFPTLKLSHNS